MSATVTALALASCTVTTDDGDDDLGAGGDDPRGGSAGRAGAGSGGGGQGGDSGEAGEGGSSAGAGGMGGTTGEAGAGGMSEAGAGGGGPVLNACDDPEPDQETARGVMCEEYCITFFSTCTDSDIDEAGFTSVENCESTCENFGDQQLCCRAKFAIDALDADASAPADCLEAAGSGDVCN